MGRKKTYENDEPFVTRDQVIKKRNLTKNFIRNELGHLMYDFGYRTKMYKLSEIDLYLKQTKKAG